MTTHPTYHSPYVLLGARVNRRRVPRTTLLLEGLQAALYSDLIWILLAVWTALAVTSPVITSVIPVTGVKQTAEAPFVMPRGPASG